MVIEDKILGTILDIEKQTIPGLMMTRIDMDVLMLSYFLLSFQSISMVHTISQGRLEKYDKLYDPPSPCEIMGLQ